MNLQEIAGAACRALTARKDGPSLYDVCDPLLLKYDGGDRHLGKFYRTALGNPALRPETTTTFEAALVSEWLGKRVKTEVGAFRNSFRNLIAFVGDTWQNIEASWARGVETSAQARVSNNILITGAYMWLDTRITASTSPTSSDTGIGDPLVHRPRSRA